MTEVTDQDNKLNGIAGWLILPAIVFALSLIVGPITLILELFSLNSAPAVFGITNFLVSLFVYIWLCYIARLFFKKRKKAPGAIITYLLVLILLQLLVGAVGSMSENVSAGVRSEWRVVFIGRFLLAVTLVPYFRHSKRVKETFTD